MDNLLIFIITFLTAIDFSGIATVLFFIWLWTGFVKIEWTTLSSFTVLLIYWIMGFFGLIILSGAVITTVCALAMFWFDMSLQDVQDRAKETVNDARPENERQNPDSTTAEEKKENIDTLTDTLTSKLLTLVGITQENLNTHYQKFSSKYSKISNLFNSLYTLCLMGLSRFRDLTNDVPIVSLGYYYFDMIQKEVTVYIKAIISLKELSKLSRAGFGDPNSTPDFSALQNIDMTALMGGLEAMGMGSTQQTSSNSTNTTENTNNTISNGTGQNRGFPGLGNMGGFDMTQMAELERNMTPEQKRQAEKAAMNMMQNFDLNQMGDLMNMFGGMNGMNGMNGINGMGGMSGQNSNRTQGLNRAQRRRVEKHQKK